MIANQSHAMSTPIDFEGLIQQGLLKKVGKSYYVDNVDALPESAKMNIKTIATGSKHGIKVTFYKDTKSIKKIAEKFKQFRD